MNNISDNNEKYITLCILENAILQRKKIAAVRRILIEAYTNLMEKSVEAGQNEFCCKALKLTQMLKNPEEECNMSPQELRADLAENRFSRWEYADIQLALKKTIALISMNYRLCPVDSDVSKLSYGDILINLHNKVEEYNSFSYEDAVDFATEFPDIAESVATNFVEIMLTTLVSENHFEEEVTRIHNKYVRILQHAEDAKSMNRRLYGHVEAPFEFLTRYSKIRN